MGEFFHNNCEQYAKLLMDLCFHPINVTYLFVFELQRSLYDCDKMYDY